MTTDRVAIERGGFTLIEVLVAMVVLAIGLLGLEALGIGAARSIALAERQSNYATLASDSLESAMHQLRSWSVPSEFCREDLPFGDRLSRQVEVLAAASGDRVATVTMRLLPNADAPLAMTDTFQISTSFYIPRDSTLSGSAMGAPCD